MSSPFSLFRRHERILMIVATGLAMISFVLLGAISDPSDLPMPLVVVFLAAMGGGIFWLAGLSRGKGTDWGLTGAIIGVVIGLAMIWSGQEPVAVEMVGGNLKGSELSEMMRQRQVANNFVQMAATSGIPEGESDTAQQAQIEANQRIRGNLFGFNREGNITPQDVVLGEVLRREADDMGMVISDAVVHKFIADVSGGNLTKNSFAKIRRTLQVSETGLMDILRQEIRAREAARLLSGRTLITPQNRWEFYKKLSVSQAAELVAVPVSSFVSDSMQPSDEELQNLLSEFNQNMPGFTPEGRPEEGRPGFFQPPKMRIAYLEAVFDDIKETVGEVTDEEIQKRFEDEYLREVPTGLPVEMKPKDGVTPPKLPSLPGQPGTKEPSAKPPAAPTKGAAPEAKPESESPEAKAEGTETPKIDDGKESSSDQKKEAPEAEKTSEPAPKEDSQSLNAETLNRLQFIAFQDDEPKKEQPATEPSEKKGLAAPEVKASEKADDKPAPAADEKKDETKEEPAQDGKPPAEEGKPADGKPEMKKAPAGGIDLPPAPTSDVPELNDELKAELRDDILRERTQKKITVLMDDAYKFVNELSRKYRNGELDKEYVSLETATEEIKEYAAKKHLEYIETPFLTLTDLRDSEDYPIGSAFMQSFADPRGLRTVVDELAQSIPTIMFNVSRARRFNFGDGGASESRFVFWKTGFKDAYSPKSIDDEDAVRQQVVKIWKQQQADPIAKKRAEELANVIRKSDQPMTESLSDETVTGEEGSLFLTIRDTGEFTMMTQGTATSPNPFQQNPPRYSVVTGAEDAGQRFFTVVFDELNDGDVGIAPNRDGSAYYVVRVKDRSPGSEKELDEMRTQFLNQGEQMAYYYMEQQLLSEYGGDWSRELIEKYDVQFFSDDSTTVDAEEG